MSDEFSIAGTRAVITGAAGDIGRALVAGLLDGDARVLAVDRDPGALAEAARDWNSERDPATNRIHVPSSRLLS